MRIFIVAYSSGSYDDYREQIVFATKDEELADKYIEKANAILKKWLPFLLEKSNNEVENDFESYVFTPRYYQFNEINAFYIQEIELR
jgi:hypothetical protein